MKLPVSSIAVLILVEFAICCFDGTAPPGYPATLIIVSGNDQTGAAGEMLPQPLVVRVTDSNAVPIRGQVVNFLVTAGNGSVFVGGGVSNAVGVVEAHWTLGAVAGVPQHVEARAVDNNTGVPIVSATFTAMAVAGAPAVIGSPTGDGQRAATGTPLPESLSVTVSDRHGNRVPGVRVSWAVVSGGGSITPSSLTSATGVARAGWTMGSTSGTAQATAAVTGVSPQLFKAEALPSLTGVTAVSAGHGHSCAVTSAGSIYCWGANDSGQIGQPVSDTFSSRARLVPGPQKWSDVSAGGKHTCGRTGTTVQCWGGNQYGELGIGSTGGSVVPPTEVVGGVGFAMVRAGAHYSCGVDRSAAAFCWGSNLTGRLGTGQLVDVNSPTAVAGALTFSTIATDDHPSVQALTCGVATTNDAYCWGANYLGQLGDSSFVACSSYSGPPCQDTPKLVVGGLQFSTVTVGTSHACGLTTTGQAYCWGEGLLLGAAPLQVCGPERPFESNLCSPFPVAVLRPDGTPLTLIQITAGLQHTCGLTAGGQAYCWGFNDVGQLGIGKFDLIYQWPMRVVGGLAFVSLDAGSYHTCGVTTAGRVYCWGANDRGRLGDGTVTNRAQPTIVITP